MLLTPKEAAARLHVSLATIYRMKDRKELPVVPLGKNRHWRVHEEKLKQMLDAAAEATIANANGAPSGEDKCQTSVKTARSGGSVIPIRAASALDALLGQKTTKKPKRSKAS